MTFDMSEERTEVLELDGDTTSENIHELRNRIYAASLALRAICKLIDDGKPSAARAAAETMLTKLNDDLEDSRNGRSHWAVDDSDDAIRILLVDDDDMEAQLLTDYLTEQGYGVSRARDGLDALNKLKQTLPDIVLLDMNMPRLDGPKTVTSIRADDRFKNLTLIAISGSDATSPNMQNTRRRVDHWITKPADPQRIAGAILEMARSRP